MSDPSTIKNNLQMILIFNLIITITIIPDYPRPSPDEIDQEVMQSILTINTAGFNVAELCWHVFISETNLWI